MDNENETKKGTAPVFEHRMKEIRCAVRRNESSCRTHLVQRHFVADVASRRRSPRVAWQSQWIA